MALPVSFNASSRVEWKVKNIFSANGQESETFGFLASLWRLLLWKVCTLEDTEVITVYLRENYAEKRSGDFTSRVFIVDENLTPQHLKERVCKFKERQYYDCVWEMDVKDFREREDVLSVDGAVSLVCILMLKATSEEEDEGKKPIPASTNTKVEGSVEKLVLDFRRLLDDSALSDVTLKCGDRTIPAHRLILSARSEVFAAMLRNDMAERRSGVIEVTDVDPPVLEQLLQFIYSCKLPDMSMDAAPELYEAADKYGVESLREVCSAFMTENLAEGNACSILLLADAHGDSGLKDSVVSFIVNTNLFVKDGIWLQFCDDHPKLANEVLNRVCKKCIP